MKTSPISPKMPSTAQQRPRRVSAAQCPLHLPYDSPALLPLALRARTRSRRRTCALLPPGGGMKMVASSSPTTAPMT